MVRKVQREGKDIKITTGKNDARDKGTKMKGGHRERVRAAKRRNKKREMLCKKQRICNKPEKGMTNIQNIDITLKS